jgi:hypothetical protein
MECGKEFRVEGAQVSPGLGRQRGHRQVDMRAPGDQARVRAEGQGGQHWGGRGVVGQGRALREAVRCTFRLTSQWVRHGEPDPAQAAGQAQPELAGR